jgi:hypothetical protein
MVSPLEQFPAISVEYRGRLASAIEHGNEAQRGVSLADTATLGMCHHDCLY